MLIARILGREVEKYVSIEFKAFSFLTQYFCHSVVIFSKTQNRCSFMFKFMVLNVAEVIVDLSFGTLHMKF